MLLYDEILRAALSVGGRGPACVRPTDRPFEQIGAPWLNAQEVARVMNGRRLPGIRFEAMTMPVAPTAAKHRGQTIPAIRFRVTDRRAYRPVRTSLLLIDEIRRRHPREFAWTAKIDRLRAAISRKEK